MNNPDQKHLSILKNSGFVKLWLNQILVQIAYNSLNFTLLLWVYQLTLSSTAVSSLMLAIYLPAVFFGIFAGILVDIIDRKKIISVIDLLMAIDFIGLLVFKNSLPAILILTFIFNALGIFYLSSESSAIPILVKKEKLLMANSLFSTTVFLSFLFGFGLSGPLINFFGVDLVFLIGAAVLMLGFVLSLFMPSMSAKLDDEAQMLKSALTAKDYRIFRKIAILELTKTLSIIRSSPQVLFAILIISSQQAIIGVLGVLIPSFFEQVLHIRAFDASLILVLPLGLGMLMGGTLIGRLGYKMAKRRLVGAGITTAGVIIALIGFGSILAPIVGRVRKVLPFFDRPSHSTGLIIGAFLLGVSLVAVIVPCQTVIQEETPESSRGKVFSVLNATMSFISLLPILIVGALSDMIGPSWIFLSLGLIIFSLGLSALLPKTNLAAKLLPDSWKQFLGILDVFKKT